MYMVRTSVSVIALTSPPLSHGLESVHEIQSNTCMHMYHPLFLFPCVQNEEKRTENNEENDMEALIEVSLNLK